MNENKIPPLFSEKTFKKSFKFGLILIGVDIILVVIYTIVQQNDFLNTLYFLILLEVGLFFVVSPMIIFFEPYDSPEDPNREERIEISFTKISSLNTPDLDSNTGIVRDANKEDVIYFGKVVFLLAVLLLIFEIITEMILRAVFNLKVF